MPKVRRQISEIQVGMWLPRCQGPWLAEAGQVAGGTVQEEQVGHRREQISDQPLAVAPEPVELRPRGVPAVALPALQRDPGDPTRALGNRGAEAAREVFAGGHRAALRRTKRNEDLAVAERVQQVAGFVVLGQAGRIERTAAARGRQPFQGRPVEARAHAVGGEEASQVLADRNVLVLVFGEFVAVEPVGPLADRQ